MIIFTPDNGACCCPVQGRRQTRALRLSHLVIRVPHLSLSLCCCSSLPLCVCVTEPFITTTVCLVDTLAICVFSLPRPHHPGVPTLAAACGDHPQLLSHPVSLWPSPSHAQLSLITLTRRKRSKRMGHICPLNEFSSISTRKKNSRPFIFLGVIFELTVGIFIIAVGIHEQL